MREETDNWKHRLYQVDFGNAHQWIKVERSEFYAPVFVNLRCPNPLCNSSLGNLPINWGFYTRQLMLALTSCGICNEIIRFYLIDPPEGNDEEKRQKSLLYIYPAPPLWDEEVPKEVQTLSPAFYQIYTQALMAENLKLNELAGMGYRKSLEFLIKDYLISKLPDKEHEIKSKFLGYCIKNYIEDSRIKKTAERAAWLGNDETHYYREWHDRDLEDLKKLLKLTLHWLYMEFLTQDYEAGMDPEKKKGA